MTQVTGFRSAFFIDTKSRLLPHGFSIAWWAKVVLLILNIPLTQMLCSAAAGRCGAVQLCTSVFVLRVLLQMSVFWSRGIPWKEVVFEAGGVIPLSVASMAHGAAGCHRPMGCYEALGLLVFFFGTWLNVYPEWQRHRWKSQGHVGQLYRRGLFSVARHINYTGEILSFVGFSFVTGVAWTLWVPVIMAAGMCTLSVREIEFYLSQRYHGEWAQFTVDVPWLMVPGLY